MSYEKINWKNLPSVETPISAENLNKMDQGIYDAHQELGKLPEWSKKETKPEYTAKEVGALPNDTDIPSKTSDLENDSGFITKEVRDLANYYTKREVDHLKANAILSKSTGETISITDAAPVPPLNIIPYGKSTQKQYEGNQLLDVSKATTYSDHLQVNSNGWMTVTIDNSSGTSILYIGVAIPVSDLLETGKQYLSVCEVKSNTLGYAEIVSPNTTNNKSQFSAGQALSAGYTGTSVKVVTTRDDFSDCKTMTRTTLRADAGVSGSITFRLSIIEDTTVTADTFVYEPFVGGEASPNLNYKQEVVPLGASGSVVQRLLGGNLFDKNNAEYKMLSVSSNDILQPAGGRMYYIKVAPNTTYTFEKELGKFNRVCVCEEMPSSGVKVTNKNSDTSQNIAQITTGANDRYLAFYPLLAEEFSTISYEAVLETVNIYVGDVEPKIDSYSEQSLTYQTPNGLHGIPLGQTIPAAIKNSAIHMSGVYWDEVEQQYYIGNTKNENGKDVQRVWSGKPKKTIVFTSQNASYVCSVFDTEIFGVKFLNGDIPSMSTIAPWSTWALKDKTIAVSTNGLFYTDKSKTLEEVNALFTELGTDFEVEGILDTPIVTDTSEEELAQFNALRMNYPNTTIVNDAGAYTEVEYVADTHEHIKQNYAPKSEIQEMKDQIAELQALMVNNS